MKTVSGTLPRDMWEEPSSSSFHVRSKSYLQTKHKIPSAPSIFKLNSVDLFSTSAPMHNIAGHPLNSTTSSFKENNNYYFVVNILIPGPPYLSFVLYFSANKASNASLH